MVRRYLNYYFIVVLCINAGMFASVVNVCIEETSIVARSRFPSSWNVIPCLSSEIRSLVVYAVLWCWRTRNTTKSMALFGIYNHEILFTSHIIIYILLNNDIWQMDLFIMSIVSYDKNCECLYISVHIYIYVFISKKY